MKNNTIRNAAVALILLPLLAGCGEKSSIDMTRESFDRIAEDAASLYAEIHPLRASRLGIESADSILFTFSPEEIEHALITIDTLKAAVSTLAADDLDEDRIDGWTLLSDWMKGETFVFTQSRTCLNNPLLFSWMIEEALMGIPTRPYPPTDGERHAWAVRISRLPALVENASTFLRKPGGIHLEEAAKQLSSLTARMPRLTRLVEERYGGPVAELDEAREALRTYRERIDALRNIRTSSRQIMGMEELSRILLYGEHLDFDQAKMVKEAEKIMRRLARQLAPKNVAVTDTGTEQVTVSVDMADSLLKGIDEGIAARRAFGMKNNPRSPVAGYEELWKPLRLPVNPCLCLPVIPERDIYWAFEPGEKGSCVPSVFVPDGREYSLDQLKYDLLLTSSLMSAPDRSMCGDKSPLRKIFGVETYRYAWKAHNSTDLTALIPERRMQLTRIQTGERVAAIARMVLVFRLHSGKYTTEAAREYLGEMTPFDGARIEDEVIMASVSPAAALEGIAFMTAESMVKNATIDRTGGKPREKTRKLLLDSAGMPPYLLLMRTAP